MSEEKSRHWMAYLLANLYIGLSYGWSIWSASSHRLVEVVCRLPTRLGRNADLGFVAILSSHHGRRV